MITIKNSGAQGDVYISRINEIPDNAIEIIQNEKDKYIVGHSESGHHHTVPKSVGVLYRDPDNQFVLFMRVTEPAVFTHERSFDQHEALQVLPGDYKLINQREYSPEGWIRAAD